MKTKPSFFSAALRYLLVMVCTIAVLPGDTLAYSPLLALHMSGGISADKAGFRQ